MCRYIKKTIKPYRKGRKGKARNIRPQKFMIEQGGKSTIFKVCHPRAVLGRKAKDLVKL